ncbi:pilus assembly protein TadG-related protein [Thioclava sp. GXIMD2076]|uniref:pilus assembly protein TadG-related protein n=1 Tax=unclassified Thioclava TaxID=2621713 RepID=UPI0030CFFF95
MVHSRTRLPDMACRSLRPAMRMRDEETGAILPLTIILLTVLLVLSGVALDFMHFEARRTQILAVLDRASLAAASLSQELDPELVVDDYLKKAGLEDVDRTVTVTEGSYGEWRRVRIEATDTMTTSFMGQLAQIGIKTLSTKIVSEAYEAIGNVEVSLVLDVSGSMATDVGDGVTRLAALQEGADTFVDQMFTKVQPENAPDGRLSISVIPYNQQVVLGDDLAAQFNLSTEQTDTTCGDVFLLPTDTIAISPTTAIQRTMSGDSLDYYVRFGYNADNYNGWQFPYHTWVSNCDEQSYSPVLPFSNSQTDIEKKIGSLKASGDTAIDIGARWGLALLDPAAQPVVDNLISEGDVDSSLDARPYEYDLDGTADIDDRSIKVMVLMTDGENTGSFSIKQKYQSGPSELYSTKSADSLNPADSGSTNSSTTSEWDSLYWHDDSYSTTKWYRLTNKKWYYRDSNGFYTTSTSRYGGTQKNYVSDTGKLYQIDWSTVWGKLNFRHEYVAYTYFDAVYKTIKRSTSFPGTYAVFSDGNTFTKKDTALKAICTTAKANDILIYTLAVDAPDNGAAILKSCSSGDGYYYDITSDELTDAFAEIAASINSLRLTN